MESLFVLLSELTEYERSQFAKELKFADYETIKKAMNIYLKIYPYFDAMMEAVHFAFKLCFLFGSTKFDCAMNYFLRTVAVRIDIKDLRAWKANKDIFKAGQPQIRSYFLKVLFFFGTLTKFLTLATIFGYRWMDWFFVEEHKLIQRRKLPVPPPPPILIVNKKHNNMGYHQNKENNTCGMCDQMLVHRNSACIPSGYVFCYECIFPYVKEHKCCPVTNLPCEPLQIRRIYF